MRRSEIAISVERRSQWAADPDLEDEASLLRGLRAGDEATFRALVGRYHWSLVRLAKSYVTSEHVAEEAVQEAWIYVLRGLDAFEERSSLKTWIFAILINVARRRSQSERRSAPFSSVGGDDPERFEPTVMPDRFRSSEDARPGGWISFPRNWRGAPEEQLLSVEAHARARAAIDSLPARQRSVIVLRQVEGRSSAEVSALLHITENNQRVLLHRARSKVREVFDRYLEEQ